MLKSGIFAAALAAATFVGGNAFAAPISATAINADCATDVAAGGTLASYGFASAPGQSLGCSTDSSRTSVGAIEFNVPATGNFYSLGLNGTLAFDINPDFVGPGSIAEVTNPSKHKEAVDIYGSFDGIVWTKIIRLLNNTGSPSVTTALFVVPEAYSYIGFVDATTDQYGTNTSSTDGYDIASFSLTAVPLPATLPLMMGALGGLALVRRASRRA